jgi:uncharacterized protein
MIIDPVGSAKKKYRKRIEDAKKKAIGSIKYYELGTLKRGQPMKIRIPILHIPHIVYGPWAPNIASGPGEEGEPLFPDEGEAGSGGSHEGGRGVVDAIYEEITMKDLINYLKDELELEMVKPGKRKKFEKMIYPSYSPRGPESLLDIDETIDAMIERHISYTKIYKNLEKRLYEQIADVNKKIEEILKAKESNENANIDEILNVYNELKSRLESKLAWVRKELKEIEFEPGKKLKIKIDEEDLRYKMPKIIYKEQKDAIIINIRDVSGSITQDDLEASWTLSKLIDIWLTESYKDSQVERVYIAHNDWAWEETEEGYYKLQPGGGTSFTPAYQIIQAMIKGEDYPRKTQVRRKIEPSETDIYIIQYTDGGNWDTDTALQELEKIITYVTRYCYLETSFGDWKSDYYNKLQSKFSNNIQEGSVRLYRMQSQEEIWDALKAFFGKRR